QNPATALIPALITARVFDQTADHAFAMLVLIVLYARTVPAFRLFQKLITSRTPFAARVTVSAHSAFHAMTAPARMPFSTTETAVFIVLITAATSCAIRITVPIVSL